MPTLAMEQAHLNMVSNQVRAWDVIDARVLDVLSAVARADFVPPAWRPMAYMDLAIPLGDGEVMMKPVVEGRMLQALALLPSDEVLEIGTGSGFITACLAHLVSTVTSIELREDFADTARHHLHDAAVENAQVVVGDAVKAFEPQQRFDALVVTGAVASVPSRWREWLQPGGRAFVVCGQSPSMRALALTDDGAGQWHERSLFETDLPYLRHAQAHAQFRL